LDVTAVSVHACAYIPDYTILRSGGSFGIGYGPIVVAKKMMNLKELKKAKIAIPGKMTSAFLLLQLIIGKFDFVEMNFSEIPTAVLENKVDAGLVIHETQLSYDQEKLTKMIVGKEKAVIQDTIDDPNMIYDWKYYSERKGWDDASISEMKKFVNNVIEFGKNEGWDLDLKFNKNYCAIKTKNNYNICAIKERNGLIRIELPSLKNKDEPPDSKIDWQWSEPKSFWKANFHHNELVKVNDSKEVLRKSYNSIT